MNSEKERKLNIIKQHISKSRGKGAEKIESILCQIDLMPAEKQLDPEIQKLKKIGENWLLEFDKIEIQKSELKENKKYLAKLEKVAEENGIQPPTTEELVTCIKKYGKKADMPAHLISGAIKNAKREQKKLARKKAKMYKL